MAEFIWIPSNGSSGSREPRVNTVDFEDYKQESPAGVNNNPLKFSLVFNNVDRSGGVSGELYLIDAFLSACAGWQAFDWRPPAPHDAALKKFKCKKWDWQYVGGLVVGISADFEQDFQT